MTRAEKIHELATFQVIEGNERKGFKKELHNITNRQSTKLATEWAKEFKTDIWLEYKDYGKRVEYKS